MCICSIICAINISINKQNRKLYAFNNEQIICDTNGKLIFSSLEENGVNQRKRKKTRKMNRNENQIK